MTTTAPRTTPMMITAALVRATRCSRSARSSARFSCSRSALLGFGDLAHSGGGRRGPRPLRPVNGRHFGPPNRQFHDKLSGAIRVVRVVHRHLAGERLLSSKYEQSEVARETMLTKPLGGRLRPVVVTHHYRVGELTAQRLDSKRSTTA